LPGSIPPSAVYDANGLAGMIIWWIEQDFSVTVEEMADYQYYLLSDLLPKEL